MNTIQFRRTDEWKGYKMHFPPGKLAMYENDSGEVWVQTYLGVNEFFGPFESEGEALRTIVFLDGSMIGFEKESILLPSGIMKAGTILVFPGTYGTAYFQLKHTITTDTLQEQLLLLQQPEQWEGSHNAIKAAHKQKRVLIGYREGGMYNEIYLDSRYVHLFEERLDGWRIKTYPLEETPSSEEEVLFSEEVA